MKDPLYFSTASWSLGEQLTIKQAREAADTYTRKLGFEGQKCGEASRQVEFEGGWERADNRTKREKAKQARERGSALPICARSNGPAAIVAALTTHEVAFSPTRKRRS